MKASRFNFAFFGLTASLALITFGINLLIDPYGIWKYGGRVSVSKAAKAIVINQIQPKTLILGTSKAAIGLDPNHPVFSSGAPVYNSGIFGANIYEIKRYFDHAIANHKINRIVLGLDFFSFNHNRKPGFDFRESRIGQRHPEIQDILNFYFSIDSLRLAFAQTKKDDFFLKNGLAVRHQDGQDIPQLFKSDLLENFLESNYYAQYNLTEAEFKHFAQILSIAATNKIDIRVFISPMHITETHLLNRFGLQNTYHRWMRRLVHLIPIWDFSDCNSITTEGINNKMRNYYDSSHYTVEVGNLVLNRLYDYDLASVPPDFGKYISSENIEVHLRSTDLQCQAWKAKKPELIQWTDHLFLQLQGGDQ